MGALWNMVFWLIPIWTFLLIPFATFYYEADDGMLMAGTAYAPNPIKKSRLRQALCYQLFVIVIVTIFFLVTYLLLSDTKIPVMEYIGIGPDNIGLAAPHTNAIMIPTILNSTTGTVLSNFNATLQMANMNDYDNEWVTTTTESPSNPVILVLQVSFGTFFAGLMAWIGWFLFAIFGGIGLSAVPLDLILMYTNRPRHLDAVEFAEVQLSLRERVNELVDIGELIKIEREQKAVAGVASRFGTWTLDSDARKAAKEERQAILGFKQAVYLLEEDVEQFQAISSAKDKYNPLIPYIALLCGFVSIIISIFWFIHIIVYIFPNPPWAPFLNNYFQFFDAWFPLFGVLSVAIFTLYLLFAAVKGAFKFGIRLLLFHIHPMKVGKTYMSSFLFNLALVLLCALPVVQFCQQAFADYAAFAEIRQLFGVQIQYLQFFSIFWKNDIFIYIFFVISILTALYLARTPKDQSASGQALRDRLRASSANTLSA
jgi:LMBR1 domain-containing protein 1